MLNISRCFLGGDPVCSCLRADVNVVGLATSLCGGFLTCLWRAVHKGTGLDRSIGNSRWELVRVRFTGLLMPRRIGFGLDAFLAPVRPLKPHCERTYCES